MIIDNSKLKDLLKQKSTTKSALCDVLGISSRTIAKISKGEEVSEIVVSKICEYLNCDKSELVLINNVLEFLKKEMKSKLAGGIYHETQVRLTYNSNHIEGSKLTEDQTRHIFETRIIGGNYGNIKVDDIIETNNHFKCIDFVIDNAESVLDEKFIKHLHTILKHETLDGEKYGIGVYKIFQNTVGGIETTNVDYVEKDMKQLLKGYNAKKKILFEDIVEFHYNFEKIHPFQDGNGRVGRLLAFKECLKNNIVPFYIDDTFKFEYYNGLKNWKTEKGFLIETCHLGQDLYKRLLDYFKIRY